MLALKYLSEPYFIFNFRSGLRSDLKPMVRLLKPNTLIQAYEQVVLQEMSIDAMV